jgi:hypothetical protein
VWRKSPSLKDATFEPAVPFGGSDLIAPVRTQCVAVRPHLITRPGRYMSAQPATPARRSRALLRGRHSGETRRVLIQKAETMLREGTVRAGGLAVARALLGPVDKEVLKYVAAGGAGRHVGAELGHARPDAAAVGRVHHAGEGPRE